jgi:hypothetical protein
VRDLLSDELEPVRLELDPLGGLLLNGLTRIHCGSIHEVLACLDTGSVSLPPPDQVLRVSHVSAVLRIRDVYPGSEYLPPRTRIKELKYFCPKTRKYDPDCSSRIDPVFGSSFLPFPDPGFLKAPDHGS